MNALTTSKSHVLIFTDDYEDVAHPKWIHGVIPLLVRICIDRKQAIEASSNDIIDLAIGASETNITLVGQDTSVCKKSIIDEIGIDPSRIKEYKDERTIATSELSRPEVAVGQTLMSVTQFIGCKFHLKSSAMTGFIHILDAESMENGECELLDLMKNERIKDTLMVGDVNIRLLAVTTTAAM
jgi:hypothetical protein